MTSAATPFREPVPLHWSEGLDVDAVLAGQGLDPGLDSARLPALLDAARRALREALPLVTPAVATRTTGVDAADLLQLTLSGGGVVRGGAALRTLSGSLRVVAAVCTIGEAAERRARELLRQHPVLAMAIDGLGTAAVNLLAEAVCRDLKADAARAGHQTTAPLSPGQGDWDLEEGQRLLFGLAEPQRIGVALSPGAQMRPCKSLSFLVGIGPTVQQRAGGSCVGCSARPGCHWSTFHRRSGDA